MDKFVLNVEPIKCLRRDYADNECSICINFCPEKAISFNRGHIAINETACTICHGCVGICPTEAIESKKFEPTFFIAKELSVEQNELKQKLISEKLTLSCKENGVCLSVFDESHLITLAMKSERMIESDLSHCAECELNKTGKLKTAIDKAIEASNDFLGEFASNKNISVKMEKIHDRRSFFKSIFKKTITTVEETKEEAEKPKTKLPLKRIMLKNAIKDTLEDTNRYINKDYRFSISKTINKECTNCKSCVEFCPTNALFYSGWHFSKIYFQSGKCVDCYICNDICEVNALEDGFEHDMAMFAFDKAKTAIELNMVVCSSCKMAFASKEGEEVCPKCIEYQNDFSHMFMTAEELEAIGKKS